MDIIAGRRRRPPHQLPFLACWCIDYRYDASAAEFLRAIGLAHSYYLITNAGAALPLSYDQYCTDVCCAAPAAEDNDDDDQREHCATCPVQPAMATLRRSFLANLRIALTLRDIDTVYLLNHQDCAAIRAFLACSGYPAPGEDTPRANRREIQINAQLLTYAAHFLHKRFKDMHVLLGLLDANGTVGDYDILTKRWRIIHIGPGKNPTALWFGRSRGECMCIK